MSEAGKPKLKIIGLRFGKLVVKKEAYYCMILETLA